MEITVAKNAGFCFGVKRATDSLEAAIEKGERENGYSRSAR
jgi:4-hydroxy-3-methylbut-2-enyl diphosphate reductase IspH